MMVLLNLYHAKLKILYLQSKGDNLGVNYQNGESVYVGLNHLYEELNLVLSKSRFLILMIDALLTIIKAEHGQRDLYQELLGQMLIYMMYLMQLNLIQQQHQLSL